MIPVAWILMKKRKFSDYKKVFGKIKQHGIKLELVLNPKSIMTDMELGAIKAFKLFWSEAKILACLFHVGQAWFKKFSKLGFKQAYVDDKRITEWFRKVFAMTLVPSSLVDDYWESVIMVEYNSLKGEFPKLTDFVEYIIENYFEGSFPKTMWCHFETVGNKTNNHLEGYNKKLRNFVGAKAPNIFKAVKVFQEEEVDAALKYNRALSPDSVVSRPPRRAHLDLTKETKLKTYMELLREDSITLSKYVEKIVSFYDFNREKLVRMEEDGDTSDQISDMESGDESS